VRLHLVIRPRADGVSELVASTKPG
jgi:hypothetical protein